MKKLLLLSIMILGLIFLIKEGVSAQIQGKIKELSQSTFDERVEKIIDFLEKQIEIRKYIIRKEIQKELTEIKQDFLSFLKRLKSTF